MTDNEIIKALKSEIHLAKYVDSSYCDCVKVSLLEATLDLISRYRAEMKRLNNEVDRLSQCVLYHDGQIVDAIKESVENVRNYIKMNCNPYGKPTLDYDTSIAIMHYIDNLVKEMTEQREEET